MRNAWQRNVVSRGVALSIAAGALVATVVACSAGAADDVGEVEQHARTITPDGGETRNDSGIVVLQDASTLDVVTGTCQWSTTNGGSVDVACCEGESAAADAGGGKVCVIGTHGNVGVIQCMPPDGVYGDSGAEQLLCSICYAGAATEDGGPSVANCIAIQQGAACEDVIACTGSVEPRGPDAKRGCAVMACNGTWVNGCNPPAPITPRTPGICYDTATRGGGGPSR